MLVLTRKVEESISIGDEITVKVLVVEGAQVKLGIDAPANVRVLRWEVFEKIREENIRSTRRDASAFAKAAVLFNATEENRKNRE